MVTKRTSFLPIQRYHKQKFNDTSFLHLKMAITKRLSNKTKQLYATESIFMKETSILTDGISVKIEVSFIKIPSVAWYHATDTYKTYNFSEINLIVLHYSFLCSNQANVTVKNLWLTLCRHCRRIFFQPFRYYDPISNYDIILFAQSRD